MVPPNFVVQGGTTVGSMAVGSTQSREMTHISRVRVPSALLDLPGDVDPKLRSLQSGQAQCGKQAVWGSLHVLHSCVQFD